MKRALLLAACLGFPMLTAESVRASEAGAAPSQQFFIQTPEAGNIMFSGTGTATFNNSLGTNNNFNVGTSTNVGVNSSASSTTEYTASGIADFKMADQTVLQQTIGTASSAFNQVQTAEAASMAAASVAAKQGYYSDWSYGAEGSAAYEQKFKQDGGWEYQAAGNGVEAGYTNGSEFVAEANWEVHVENAHRAGYEQAYNTAYSAAVTSSASNLINTTNDGTISAAFETVNKGMSESAYNAASAGWAASAAGQASYEVDAGSADYEAEWAAAYASAYNNAAAAGGATSERSSESTVNVTGIGVISKIVSNDDSSFFADATKSNAATDGGNGNANASAGLNVATSSFATQSNTTNASAFMQAFSATSATTADDDGVQ